MAAKQGPDRLSTEAQTLQKLADGISVARGEACRIDAVREVREAERHFDQLHDAIALYSDHPRHLSDTLRLVDRSSRHELGYMNPYSRLDWLRAVYTAVSGYTFTGNLYTLTLLDRRWETSTTDWHFDIPQIRRHLHGALSGFEYFGLIEVAVLDVRTPADVGVAVPVTGEAFDPETGEILPRRSPKTNADRVVAAHFQGLLWGAVSRGQWRELRTRFTGGVFGAQGARRSKVTNLASALSYGVKLPAYGYRHPIAPRGRLGGKARELSSVEHYELVRAFADYRFPDLTVAGGAGKELRAAVVQAAKVRASR